MKTEEELKEEIEKKIKKLRENHIIRNGFPVSDCGYNCYYKKRIKKLKQKLKEKK